MVSCTLILENLYFLKCLLQVVFIYYSIAKLACVQASPISLSSNGKDTSENAIASLFQFTAAVWV